MKNKNHPKFNKKCLPAIAVAVVLLGAIGLTFAISQDRSSIPNGISINQYKTTYTEVFNAPSDWKTCQKIDKTITVTNDPSSPGPVSVRVKLEEQWLDSNGSELPLVSADSGLTMAQINFTENSGWTKDGLYYYYNTDLEPGQTTTSLLTGVTLNCDANLDSDSGLDKDYAGKNYHLKVIAQTIEAENKNGFSDLYAMITSKAKRCNPDWSRGAKVSDDPTVANCNGINEYEEKGQTVYYYRGHIEDNTVLWGDKCWKIMRTTYSGGIKLIYYTEPTVVDGAKQCTTWGADAITSSYTDDYSGTHTGTTTFPINYYDQQHSSLFSLGDAGYMYGAKVYPEYLTNDNSSVFVFSKGVSRNGDTYTLDTASGQSVSKTWDEYEDGYIYFCTDGASSCDASKIGLVVSAGGYRNYYYPLGGYDNREDLRDKMLENNVDSIAKQAVESWFEDAGLSAIEGDLEDAIFCNDRTIKSEGVGDLSFGSHNSFTSPSLDCARQHDAFTKSDTTNGNGKLGHKVGLLTADEYVMGGMNGGYTDTYLANKSWVYNWTMTPVSISFNYGSYSVVGSTYMFTRNLANDKSCFRPSVSLKAGAKVNTRGDGSEQNPYIVEF